VSGTATPRWRGEEIGVGSGISCGACEGCDMRQSLPQTMLSGRAVRAWAIGRKVTSGRGGSLRRAAHRSRQLDPEPRASSMRKTGLDGGLIDAAGGVDAANASTRVVVCEQLVRLFYDSVPCG